MERSQIFGKAEIWRLITPFFYGGSGIPLVFDVFLLYRNANDLYMLAMSSC